MIVGTPIAMIVNRISVIGRSLSGLGNGNASIDFGGSVNAMMEPLLFVTTNSQESPVNPGLHLHVYRPPIDFKESLYSELNPDELEFR